MYFFGETGHCTCTLSLPHVPYHLQALWSPSKDDPNAMEAFGDDPDMRQDEPKGCWGSFTNCIGGNVPTVSVVIYQLDRRSRRITRTVLRRQGDVSGVPIVQCALCMYY